MRVEALQKLIKNVTFGVTIAGISRRDAELQLISRFMQNGRV